MLVGINLLREGLDIPEVSLGIPSSTPTRKLPARRACLESEPSARRATSTGGRSLRRQITDSMRRALDETRRRRAKQIAFNEANGIVPHSVSKKVKDLIDGVYGEKRQDDLKARHRGRGGRGR